MKEIITTTGKTGNTGDVTAGIWIQSWSNPEGDRLGAQITLDPVRQNGWYYIQLDPKASLKIGRYLIKCSKRWWEFWK